MLTVKAQASRENLNVWEACMEACRMAKQHVSMLAYGIYCIKQKHSALRNVAVYIMVWRPGRKQMSKQHWHTYLDILPINGCFRSQLADVWQMTKKNNTWGKTELDLIIWSLNPCKSGWPQLLGVKREKDLEIFRLLCSKESSFTSLPHKYIKAWYAVSSQGFSFGSTTGTICWGGTNSGSKVVQGVVYRSYVRQFEPQCLLSTSEVSLSETRLIVPHINRESCLWRGIWGKTPN